MHEPHVKHRAINRKTWRGGESTLPVTRGRGAEKGVPHQRFVCKIEEVWEVYALWWEILFNLLRCPFISLVFQFFPRNFIFPQLFKSINLFSNVDDLNLKPTSFLSQKINIMAYQFSWFMRSMCLVEICMPKLNGLVFGYVCLIKW